MIRVQHANPKQVRDLLTGSGAKAYWDDQLRVVVVSGTPSEVASLEQTVKELDAEISKTPMLNAEITTYVLGASQEDAGSDQIPPALRKTADEIKAAFPYHSYRLLETVVARSRVGEPTFVSGTLKPFKDNPDLNEPATYSLRFRLASITNGMGRDQFRIEELQFEAGFPLRTGPPPSPDKGTYATAQWQRSPARIQTGFDISSNQQIVIGKAGVAGNSAVFLIVEAKAVK
jgi:Bacterial type II/III secretion system short domain